MIKFVDSASTSSTEAGIGSRFVIEPCSDACVLRGCPPNGAVVAQGVFRNTVAVLADDQLWLTIAADTHRPDHPLVFERGVGVDVSTRRSLIERIRQARPRHVAPVIGVCNCSFTMPVVGGTVLIDDETRPTWHRRRFRESAEAAAVTLPWERLAGALADLADGLIQLHDIGIAHNDPFPYNAIVTEQGEAVWIDFNSCVPANPETEAVDVVGFVAYTFLTSLIRSGRWEPSVIESVRICLQQSPASRVLADVARALRTQSGIADGEPPMPLQELKLCLATLNAREDVIGRVARALTAQGLATYFNEYGMLRQVAARRDQLLNAERTRHQVVESELHRTSEIRREQEIGALKEWVAELERGKAWLDEQRVNWQARAEHVEVELRAGQSRVEVLEKETLLLVEDLRQAEAVIEAMRPIVAETEELKKALDRGRRAMKSLDAQSYEVERLKVALDGTQTELQAIRSGLAWQLMRLMWRWRARLAPPASLRSRMLGGVARRLGLRGVQPPAAVQVIQATSPKDDRQSAEDDVVALMSQQRAKIRDSRARSRGDTPD